jgi:hypothetical protein
MRRRGWRSAAAGRTSKYHLVDFKQTMGALASAPCTALVHGCCCGAMAAPLRLEDHGDAFAVRHQNDACHCGEEVQDHPCRSFRAELRPRASFEEEEPAGGTPLQITPGHAAALSMPASPLSATIKGGSAGRETALGRDTRSAFTVASAQAARASTHSSRPTGVKGTSGVNGADATSTRAL